MSKSIQQSIQKFLSSSICGLHVTVKTHHDPTISGIAGEIINETKFMMHIRTEDGIKKITKLHGMFTFQIDESMVTFQGKLLVGLEKERAKRKMRSW